MTTQLNDRQTRENIQNFNHGKAIVLAPAGCGKTELLIKRLEIASKNNINPEEMLCITFTNRAALNMRERSGIDEENPLFVGNFHQFGTLFLRKNKIISHNTTVLDDQDMKLLYDDILKDLRQDHTYQELATAYAQKNSTDMSPNTLIEKSHAYYLQVEKNIDPVGWTPNLLTPKEKPFEFLLQKISQRLTEIKQRYNCIDFNDILILLSDALLNPQNQIAEIKYMNAYRWIQIDEVQDLNPFQWRIIQLLTDQAIKLGNECILLFGDYQQSIYAFLDAGHHLLNQNIDQFEIFKLKNNFRSKELLVDLFNNYTKNAFQTNWRLPIESTTKSNINDHRLAIIKVEGTIFNELEKLLDNFHQKKNLFNNEQSIGILVRKNETADMISRQLNLLGISHFKMSGNDLFKRAIIKDAFAFASLIMNKNNWLAWSRLWGSFDLTTNFADAKDRIYELLQTGFSFEDYLKYHNGFKLIEEIEEHFMQKRVVVFDTETTGLNFENDLIVQIAGIEVIQGQVGTVFERFIKIDRPVGDSEKIHHISDNQLAEFGVDLQTALSEFKAFVGDSALFAHNAFFDMNMLQSHLKKINLEWNPIIFDTLQLARRAYPYEKRHNLDYLIKLLNVEGVNSHNAVDDVYATINVVSKILKNHQFKLDNDTKYLNTYLIKFDEKLRYLCEHVFSDVSQFTIRTLFEFYFNIACQKSNFYQNEFPKISIELSKLYRHMDTHFPDYLTNAKKIDKIIKFYAQKQEADLIISSDRIVVSTVHKAKGLEFETIYIPACNDAESFPTYPSSLNQADIDEEARLFYVALTRAKQNIIISYHTKDEKDKFIRHESRYLKYLNKSKFKELYI